MLEVKLNLKNSNEEQQVFADEAVARLKTIVNNQSFLDAVLNANYSRSKLWLDDGNYVEASNQKIIEIITSGKERLTEPNNIIELEVALEKLGKKTVGAVNPPNPLITTNRLFFDDWMLKNDSLSLSAQWMHEWLHVAGFLHAKRKVDRNDVNYTIGTLAIKIGRELDDAKGVSKKFINQLGSGYLETVERELKQ